MSKKVDLNNRNIGVTLSPDIYNAIIAKSKATGDSYSKVALDEILKRKQNHTDNVNILIKPNGNRTEQLNLVTQGDTKKMLYEHAESLGRKLSDYCYRVLTLAFGQN